MRAAVRQMLTCDAVATLPNWVDSPGAQLEVYVAGRLGIQAKPASTYIGDQVQP